MALVPTGFVSLPPFRKSSFDHGDVHLASQRIFLAHTSEGTVEVIDAQALIHAGTIPGCPDASGVLCNQDGALVFAAARGGGKVLVIDPGSLALPSRVSPTPSGTTRSDSCSTWPSGGRALWT